MASKAKELGSKFGAKVDKEELRRKAEAAKGKLKKTFYDEDDGTFLGRTAESWGKILGFYLIYYFLLFLLFMFSLKVFEWNAMTAHGAKRPVINTRLDEPGLVVVPHNYIIEDKDNKLLPYEKVEADTEDDAANDHFENIIDQYYFKVIKPNLDTCHPDGPVHHYTRHLWNHTVNTATGENGFRDSLRKGKPVVLLKLARIINWQPVAVNKAKGKLLKAIEESNTGHFLKDMVYFTCQDADASIDEKGRTVPGNVKQIVFHNPSACGELSRAHNFGCLPAHWYGEHEIYDRELKETVLEDNMYTGRDPWENNRKCEHSKSGQVCSCQPFVAMTIKAYNPNQPVNVKCEVHLANVEAQMDNPTSVINYGWAKFGFGGSGFPEKKNRGGSSRRRTYG